MDDIYPNIKTIHDKLSSLVFPENIPKLTKQNISEILGAYQLKNNVELLEFVDVLILDGYDTTLKNLKENKEYFYKNSSIYKDFEKEKLLEELTKYKKKLKYERDYNCPRCESNDIEERDAQTRAADEGTTLFRTCQDCGKSF